MAGVYGVPKELSVLQKQRVEYSPELPPNLRVESISAELGDTTTTADSLSHTLFTQHLPHTYGQPLVHFVENAAADSEDCTTKELPVLKVGFVFCGRQSPGGHNVVWGLYDALKKNNAKSSLVGFVGGTEGLFAQKTLEITEELLSTYKNQGGYDLLGRTKDQIKTTQQLNAALATCQALELDGLVIAGGVTSNTDAAQLAEFFVASKCKTKVVGVPITLHGDLKNQFVEADVGFDTICKVNSQLISNICTDALSAEKYYYFIRVIGRKASHVSLECALQCHPNMVVILGEEVASSKQTLFDITNQIADVVQARAQKEKYHGVIIMPEGLIESIPEMRALLNEIHSQLKRGVPADNVASQLSPWASALFEFMPPFMKRQLLLVPDSDDSAQLSQIELEKLLAQLVETEIEKRTKEGNYKGKKFSAICHFFGYQARGSLPSKFDCDYAYALGHVSYHVISADLNGYMATVTNLKNSFSKWRCGAVPITAMMSVNQYAQDPSTKTVGKLAIFPATVDLKGKTYEMYKKNCMSYMMDDIYRNPGPIQYEGPGSEEKTITLCAGEQDYMGKIKDLQDYLHKVQNIVKPGCSQDVLNAALSSMASVTKILKIMSAPSYSGHSYL